MVAEPNVRLAIINAILRDIATKDYVDKRLREHEEKINKRIDDAAESINKRIDDLNKRIDDVNKRIDTLEKFLASSLIAIVVTLATTILLKFIP